jgi:putative FmdB family regulatory protein
MPTYEFRCPDGHSFERFYRKMSEGVSEMACPECGKVATRQLSGGAGLVFKGSGFYLTDYGKNAHRKGGDAPAAKATEGSSTGETKSESASAEKPAESKSTDSKSSDAKPPSNPAASSTKSSTKSDT